MAKKRVDTSLINTFIGEDSTLKGSIHSQRSIRIEGTIEGDINSQGEVFIGQKSKIKANIVGKHVIVAGEVQGNIEAVKGLEIKATGKVYGDITGDHLMIQEGGIYKGKVNMDVISTKNPYEGESQLVGQR